jgi:CheY-like chemotaxis protein
VQRERGLRASNSKLEQAREAADSANRAKSEFLANISHEIRTPMNAILGYAQILKRRRDLPDDARRAVDTIHQSGDHLLGLIDEVLDLSKIEAGHAELHVADFDLVDLLETMGVMFELRCQQKGLGWRLERPEGDALPVRGDEAKLGQVLINLLGNAVKFTETGEVSLSVIAEDDEGYRIAVRDTGVGIAPEEQDRLFAPFQQGAAGRSAGGTGLGLAIAYRQVELMGGRLEVESTLGSGSTFSFVVSLPEGEITAPSHSGATYADVSRLKDGQQVKALVADDFEANREILSQLLTGLGVEVILAEDGQQALERVEDSRPAIVFMDIRMPVLDGLQALKALRADERWRRLPIVAVSASVMEHQRQAFLEAGFDAFVAKPFRVERICQCLAELLGVVFERDAEDDRLGGDATADWRGLALPEDLVAQLRQAAERHRVTDLEEGLAQLEGLGEREASLAAHLRQLKQRHDLAGIASLLDELPSVE